MIRFQLKRISGSLTVFFLVSCLSVSTVLGGANEGTMQLSEEAKRLILGAEKMKKRKKAESQKKTSSEKKGERAGKQKKANRGEH